MNTRIRVLERGTPLAGALAGAQFAELHHAVIAASHAQLWDAYHRLRWNELRLTRPLMAVRTAGISLLLDRRVADRPGPGAPVRSDAPNYLASGMIGKPWRPVPVPGPQVRDLDDLRSFGEPGWLKYGMEFVFAPLPGGRTFVETATICEATDAAARRRFACYWGMIRAFSGLIRRDILAGLRRGAETAGGGHASSASAALAGARISSIGA